MQQKSYVICAVYGESYEECNNFSKYPIFVCSTAIELDMFLDALEKKEQPYWDKVVKFFNGCVPPNIEFESHEVDLLTLY